MWGSAKDVKRQKLDVRGWGPGAGGWRERGADSARSGGVRRSWRATFMGNGSTEMHQVSIHICVIIRMDCGKPVLWEGAPRQTRQEEQLHRKMNSDAEFIASLKKHGRGVWREVCAWVGGRTAAGRFVKGVAPLALVSTCEVGTRRLTLMGGRNFGGKFASNSFVAEGDHGVEARSAVCRQEAGGDGNESEGHRG